MLQHKMLVPPFCDSSKDPRLTGPERDNMVLFGSFEKHRIIFFTRKFPWKYILRCCHLSPDKVQQSAQYNLCAITAGFLTHREEPVRINCNDQAGAQRAPLDQCVIR